MLRVRRKDIADSRARLHKATPDEVRDFVADHPRGLPPTTDPTLGIPVVKPVDAAEPTTAPAHPLVVMGDSLSHGFASGGVERVDLAWGAILAHELRIPFRTPNFDIEDGMPFNIEAIVRALDEHVGPEFPLRKTLRAYLTTQRVLDRNFDAWVFGTGRLQPRSPQSGVSIDNLAQFGFDLVDACQRTERTERNALRTERTPPFLRTIKNAGLRSSIRVLSHVHDTHGTPISFVDGARQLANEGGIGTLFVMLGANHALGAVQDLEIKWSGDGFDDLEYKQRYNVWRPEHFRANYNAMLEQLGDINAQRVVLCTVPHVTIAPAARGVGTKKIIEGSRYFDYYTRPWITDRQFNPRVHRHMRADDARTIDATIDLFNRHIVETVRRARSNGRNWLVFDLANTLDRMAVRRYIEDDHAQPSWWKPAVLPEALQMLRPPLDTRFFRSEPFEPDARDIGRRTQGGWFSLDGIHPSRIGYTYLAWQAANLLASDGVTFERYEQDGSVAFDWQRWLAHDALNIAPPSGLGSLFDRVSTAQNVLAHGRALLTPLRSSGDSVGR